MMDDVHYLNIIKSRAGLTIQHTIWPARAIDFGKGLFFFLPRIYGKCLQETFLKLNFSCSRLSSKVGVLTNRIVTMSETLINGGGVGCLVRYVESTGSGKGEFWRNAHLLMQWPPTAEWAQRISVFIMPVYSRAIVINPQLYYIIKNIFKCNYFHFWITIELFKSDHRLLSKNKMLVL